MNLLAAITINPQNIIEEGIGAFFGFLFALISAGIIAFINRRIEVNKLKSSLRIELGGVKDDLTNPDNATILLSYSTPFWDSIISTGSWLNFTILARRRSIKRFLEPVGKVYAKIKLLDELEKSVSLTSNTVSPNIIGKRIAICNDVNNLYFMKPLKERIKLKINELLRR